MKLAFLRDGADACPLVRLYDFDARAVAELLAGLHALASGGRQRLDVHELKCVESVAGCRLVLRTGPRDRGMVQLPGLASFECVLTPVGWDDVAGLAEPFLERDAGYQWLCRSGEAAWLLSRDGRW
jgi:hypothetical protein